MPDSVVLIRVRVEAAESPKAAAQSVNCYLFDNFAEQTAIVQHPDGSTAGMFAFADRDRELAAENDEAS